ncbi:MAG: glycosyltransferase family 2 protein [Bacteroidales bacterium]|jgi:glycosyltransferase involved in cell wall biosynthesis|nr:glycosyltransferase family 2 protein [Bacteroidales bacterium]
MIWAALIILYLTFLRMSVALVNLLTRPHPGSEGSGHGPMVSVLVPARNEEKNIGRLLDSLIAQKYEPLEIIVYNDASTDGTEKVLREYAAANANVRYINGSELPEGWLGKNRACHLLASEAKGDFFLFIDADVTAGSTIVSSAVRMMEEGELALFSVFPHQEMHTRGERVVVPIMNWILLSLLPMILVRRCRWSSFSAANGQFMMFRASVYQRYRFHEMVRMRLAEDIAIARLMKRERLRIQTLVSRGDISCRMYTGYADAINGFAKNVITMFGDSRMFILFFLIISIFGWLPVLVGVGWPGMAAYLLMVILINLSVAAASGQKIMDAFLFFPERMAAFVRIVFGAFAIRGRKSYEWKERRITEIV